MTLVRPPKQGLPFAKLLGCSGARDLADLPGFLCFGNAAVIAAGACHSVVATSAGVVRDWGNNQFGQLGNGTANQATVPIQVMSPSQ